MLFQEEINSELELQQAYIQKCRATKTHLIGLNVEGMASECHLHHESSTPIPSPWESAVFKNSYWWEAIATFCDITLGKELKSIIKSSHGTDIVGLN